MSLKAPTESVFYLIEHKQYDNKKCRSHSRHYIIIVGTAPTAATKLHAVLLRPKFVASPTTY